MFVLAVGCLVAQRAFAFGLLLGLPDSILCNDNTDIPILLLLFLRKLLGRKHASPH